LLSRDYKINNRTAKQCRERWFNNLDPEINKDPISSNEEKKIFEYYKLHGSKWVMIAKHFNGR
jgi:hypothetical protein